MKEKENRVGKIEITNKNQTLTKYIILVILVVIGVSIVTGAITSKYIFKKMESQEKSAGLKDGLFEYGNATSDASADARDVISIVSQSIVSIGRSSKGLDSSDRDLANTSGTVIDSTGIILTNYSDIKDFKEIYVKLPNKGVKPEKATLLGHNKETDLALIKIAHKDLIPIKFANTNDVKEGQLVFALGNSTGDNYIGLITPGIVTSINHRVVIDGEAYSVIQTNAVMNNENFGGPLCNSKGQLVGLNSSKATKELADKNLYFSVGIDAIKESMNSIIETSNKLGIKGAELQTGKGFYVTNVSENGVAYEAGIKPIDIILSINGKDVSSIGKFKEIVDNIKPGDKLNCIVLRDGKEVKIEIKM